MKKRKFSKDMSDETKSLPFASCFKFEFRQLGLHFWALVCAKRLNV